MLNDIVNGKYDSQLDSITTAIKFRKEQLARSSYLQMNIGDKVRFNSQVRPKYLMGKTGTIVAKKQKKVIVDLDALSGRFYKNVTCPVSLIEKV